MLYSEYINKAKGMVIEQDDDTKTWYLHPEWRFELYMSGMGNLKFAERDFRPDWSTIEDTLKLEVERRNAVQDKRNYVLNWLYDTLSSQVEPAILAEETDYIRNMMEYMKLNHDLETETKLKAGDFDGDEDLKK